MSEPASELLEVAREHLGGSLRALSSYEERTYEFHHLRDDVRERYSEEEIEQIFDNLVISGMSREYLEHIFHAGDIECSMYGFEEAAMFRFFTDDLGGFFISFDRDADINLENFISDCKTVMGNGQHH